MKKEIIIFVIGLFVGAIISTASIYVYTLVNSNGANNSQMQMPNTNGGMQNGQTPPEKPEGNTN